MFSSLGLFSSYNCTDASLCQRPKCMFRHSTAAEAVALSSPRRPGSAVESAPPAKRPRPTVSTASTTVASRNTALSISATKSAGPTTTTPGATPLSGRQSTIPGQMKKPINLDNPPMLQVGRATPQPVSDRQKALRTLYTQFAKLYAPVLQDKPSLAHESALTQEQDISKATPNLKAYKLAIHQAAVSISKRPVPDSMSHSSIGTVREVRAAQEAEAIAKASALTPERLEGMCMSVEEMVEWGYPDPRDTSLAAPIPEGTDITAEGQSRLCDRCKIEFVVSTHQEFGVCHFHHGRISPERVDGKRVWIYSCCKKERGSAGCQEGVHVFSNKDDDSKLAAVVPFKTTEAVTEGRPGDTVLDVVALDCEMIYTTAGSSLGRLSMVGGDGEVLLDEFVRQPAPVLDYNTRFSGISSADIEKAVMDLSQVRASACSFIGPNTVMVGHGLENDLRAMRLLHSRVVDTAIVFPHDRGKPYRRALRDLVKEKLGYFIQAATTVAGHSSLEDARATLELLKWKVRDDQD